MRAPAAPLRQDIVLIGGGHTHVQVLTAFAMRPEPGIRLTLVTDRLETPYSGMLPGHVAGLYRHDEMHIDLGRLARATGARLILAEATGLDRQAGDVLFADRPPLRFDALSLNIGIKPDLGGIAGAEEFGIAVKPISSFLARLDALLAEARRPDGPRRFAIIGGGAAGVELAFALKARLARELGPAAAGATITLLSRNRLVPGLNAGAHARVTRRLLQAGIAVDTSFAVRSVERGVVRAADGRSLPTDAVIFATAARAPSWLAGTGLPLAADGSLRTSATLLVEGESRIFAVGDCATITDDPRPKAGVFAVRQGPVLAENLRAAVTGRDLRPYRAQRAFLTLLMTGDGRAIAGRGRFLSAEGRLVWRWKDRIDRRFMAMFSQFGQDMARAPTAAELESGEAMRCGGCAAKIGPDLLTRALSRLPPAPPATDTILVGLDAADDAAVVSLGEGRASVETIDQIRAMIDDPYRFGQIAALHAMSDVVAMGGEPTRALALAGVPHGAPQIVAGDLHQLLAGARRALDEAGVALVGGHSAQAETLSLGLAVIGRIDPAALRRKGAALPGDRIILTKPIGTGIVMAADMRGACRGGVAEAAIRAMLRPNATAARLAAARAHAITDVTGFGLAGHLLEMLRAARLSARLDLAGVPLLEGALALAEAGHRSSLTAQNLALAGQMAAEDRLSDSDLALLFDPQTSGPLLIALPSDDAEALCAALHAAGDREAAIIGEILPAAAAGAPPLRCAGHFGRQADAPAGP
jgi:selenide,water dikinase